MPALDNPAHEAFAQARFAGKSLIEAHASARRAAGSPSDPSSEALAKEEALAKNGSRLNRLPSIQERIAELFREAAAHTAYEKATAVRDLLAIIHTSPADVDENHPLCEVRMGRDGPYHRLPPKLQAMSRLIKLMGWDQPVEMKVELKDNFRDRLREIRAGRIPDPSTASDETDLHVSNRSTTARPRSTVSRLPGPRSMLSPRQEKFVHSRVKGLGLMEAYRAAGFKGGTPNLAWRLSTLPSVKARIAELNGGIASATGYTRDDAIRELIAIIRARPTQAGPDHPYCEERQSYWGAYHRFPSKLAALSLLARLLGWNGPERTLVAHDPDAKFKQLAEFVRHRS